MILQPDLVAVNLYAGLLLIIGTIRTDQKITLSMEEIKQPRRRSSNMRRLLLTHRRMNGTKYFQGENSEPGLSQNSELINPEFTKKMNDIQQKFLFKIFGTRIREHTIPNQLPDLKEDWQRGEANRTIRNKKNDSSFLFAKLHISYFIAESLTMLTTLITIWITTVEAAFEASDISFARTVFGAISLMDVLVGLNTARVQSGCQLRNRWEIFLIYAKGQLVLDLLSSLVLVLLLLINQQVFVLSCQVILAILFSIKAKIKYSNIRPFIDHNFSKEHVTLVTSFLFMLAMSHMFAMALHLIGIGTSEPMNWLKRIGIEKEQWSTRYIYSIYWAITTLVTVGYGDITPQNRYEVVVVIIVELVGISFFGYMINIIGMTLSEIKSRNQSLQKQLTIADKMSKSFSLQDDLTYRLKNYLTNNFKADSFSLQEQNKIVQKLNPSLKCELLGETNIKILKKSLFFLTYFSKQLQKKLSLKLIKAIVQPGQPLVQIVGEQAISIVSQGCLDVSIERINRDKRVSKRARSLVPHAPNDICRNVYGYSEVITGKKVNIKAESTQFTIIYQLKKKDFYEILASSIGDYEVISELKDRYLFKRILESVEVPQLIDSKSHFCPSYYLTVKRHNKSQTQDRDPEYNRVNDPPKRKALILHNLQRIVNVDSAEKRNQIRKEAALFNQQSEDEVETVEEPRESIKTYNKYMVRCNIDRVLERYKRFREKKLGRKQTIKLHRPSQHLDIL